MANIAAVKERGPRIGSDKFSIEAVYASSEETYASPGPTTELSRAYQSTTPAYAQVALNHGKEQHTCCIDSGSGISLIDSAHQKRYLNHIKVNPHTSFKLQGLGSSLCSGWIEVELTFKTDKAPITLPIALFVVPNLETKLLIANDFLKKAGVTINLADELLTFESHSGLVPINCTTTPNIMEGPDARVKEAYLIRPGHQAQIPVYFVGAPWSEFTYLEPRDFRGSDAMVARSIHRSDAKAPCVHVINLGSQPLTLRAGQSVGTPVVLLKPKTGPLVMNVKTGKPFEVAIDAMDINPELSAPQAKQIHDLLRSYPRAFAHGEHSLGNTDWVQMDIVTGDAKPISLPPYHASPHQRRVIEENIAQLLSDDVIEESDSPWASPAILVKQKGKERFCIDYRKLNEVTKADQYPIPRIDDILSQFSGKTFFTTFDANKGFNQIAVKPEDRQKTAFRTHQGLHQYKRMPFGLRNGPSVFQRFMDKVLGRYKWQCVLVYIDDIIIYSTDFDQHLKDIEKVLALTESSGLTLSPSKSHIAYPSIKALGHSVSNLGIGTAEETVRAVTDFPIPVKVKQLQRFLGLAVYYRRFIKDFSQVAAPLYALLKKDAPWEWSQECVDSTAELKKRLTTAPILAHPDYSKPFVLHTDASTVGLGAVLSQIDEQQREHPILFLSRSLTDAEKNYGATELECLAIIWAVRKLHPYLDGSQFSLITDHSALQWLFDYSGSNKRLIRWTMDLQPYRPNMTIRYKPGRVHSNADPLSRAPHDQQVHSNIVAKVFHITVLDTSQTLFKDIREGYAGDLAANKILTSILSDSPLAEYRTFSSRDGLLLQQSPGMQNSRIYIPEGKMRLYLLSDYHDSKLAGHLGTAKTLASLGRDYYWPGLARDVKDYVRSCNSCQRNKSDINSNRGLLQPLPIPPQRWHTVAMDFAGPFAPSGEGKWDQVFIVTDKLTKRSHFIPSKTTDTATDTATRFFTNIVRLHGLPSVIISDRDVKFTSLFWSTLFDTFGTRLALSTAYHPQTDGQSERMVRTFKEMLRHYISNKQTDWTDHIATLEFAYNNSVHASTGFTPFELDLGWHPSTPHTVSRPDARNVAAVEDFHATRDAMQIAAQDAILKSQEQQAHHHNKGRSEATFKVGDLVLLSNRYIRPPHLRTKGSPKLRSKFIGPFPIIRQASATSYELDLPTTVKSHPVINIEYLKPYNSTPTKFAGREQAPPPPTENPDTAELEYTVDKIVDHRTRNKQVEYLLHWEGYADHDNEWHRGTDLPNLEHLIADYWKTAKAPPRVATRSGVTNVVNNRGTRIYHIQEPASRLGNGGGIGREKEEKEELVVLRPGDGKYRGSARAFTYASTPRSLAKDREPEASRRPHSQETRGSDAQDRRGPYQDAYAPSTWPPRAHPPPASEDSF
jgi:hypothetical protein